MVQDDAFVRGKNLLEQKHYKEAIAEFTRSLQTNPSNFDSLFYRAVAWLDFSQAQKCVDDLQLLLQQCPDYRKTCYIVLSIAYRRVGDFLGSIRTLTKALQKYPRYVEALIARGQIFVF